MITSLISVYAANEGRRTGPAQRSACPNCYRDASGSGAPARLANRRLQPLLLYRHKTPMLLWHLECLVHKQKLGKSRGAPLRFRLLRVCNSVLVFCVGVFKGLVLALGKIPLVGEEGFILSAFVQVIS